MPRRIKEIFIREKKYRTNIEIRSSGCDRCLHRFKSTKEVLFTRKKQFILLENQEISQSK